MLAAALAVFISGVAIFFAPGAALLAASRVPLAGPDRVAFGFATSLVLLTATFALCLALGLSLSSASATLAALTAVSASAARVFVRQRCSADVDQTSSHLETARDTSRVRPDPDKPHRLGDSPKVAWLVLAVLLIASVTAAVLFAPIGSIDRWWYLAYVRGYLQPHPLTLAEPFLGTGESFARFGVHPWLFGLALWSRWSGVDPVTLYEAAAPIAAVGVSFCSAVVLARELFQDRVTQRLSVVASVLLWNGGVLPVLARAGEDKILAAAALAPLCLAALLRLLRTSTSFRQSSGLFLLALAATATAATHTLVYAFALLILVPTLLVSAASHPTKRRIVGVAAAVLLVVAVVPALNGIVVQQRLTEIGAELHSPDHPVVRVHEGRERLLSLPVVGAIVTPRLLLHPLSVLAFVGGLLLLRRRSWLRREGGVWTLLAVATALPLAIAYIPPLPNLAGHVIPPWMVYRVLWLLPLGPLAAAGASALARRWEHRELGALAILMLLGVPAAAWNVQSRIGDHRERLATPATEDFVGMVRAVSDLPADSLIAAAPELSERLPAFTGRAMVATLDRSTVVFSGSRSDGEDRLRLRSMALLADLSGDTTLREVAATHVVFDPSAREHPDCSEEIFRSESYVLCRAHQPSGQAEARATLMKSPTSTSRVIAEGHCQSGRERSNDPWSALPAVAYCRIDLPPEWREREGLVLQLQSKTGRASDEWMIRVENGQQGEVAYATKRVAGTSEFALRLPVVRTGAIEVRVASAFLPRVRVGHISLRAPSQATE